MNIKDGYGRNVFHIAAKSANLVVMEYLLDKIDARIKYEYITAKNLGSRTPLMIVNERSDEFSDSITKCLEQITISVAGKAPRVYFQ